MSTNTFDETAKPLLISTTDENGNLKAGNWLATIIPHLLLVGKPTIDNSDSSATFTFTVQPQHCNRMHSLHGGCIASIFDFTTTLALARVSRPGFWEGMGVSRTLSVTYLRPAPACMELVIECEVVQVGRTLATIKGTMKRASDGQLVAVCEHGKVNTDSRSRM